MGHSSAIDYDRSEPNSKVLGWSVLISGIFLAVTISSALIYYRTTLTVELNRKENVGVSLELRQQRLADAEVLSSLKWADQQKGLVKIPIELAMKRVETAYTR